MLKLLRNLSLLVFVLALSAAPVSPDTCGECLGNCTYNGDDLGCGGSFYFCIVNGCFSYICLEADGMGVIC